MKTSVNEETITAHVLPICRGCKLHKSTLQTHTMYAEGGEYCKFITLECEHLRLCEYIANRAIKHNAKREESNGA